MGGTARQFNKMYIDYKQQFKKPIHIVASLMPQEFSDDDFIATFKRLYPYMWSDLEKQYLYWHGKNEYLIKHGKKSRYNFRKPYNFILDCSYHVRKNLRKNHERTILSDGEKAKIEAEILADYLVNCIMCRRLSLSIPKHLLIIILILMTCTSVLK